ncbi:MAG: hypothetical protein GQ529_07120 [Methyloprofundus sp.]|nr:hypothetical protein [Methyloprofundus sp.]
MNKSILSLLTCFSLLVVSHGAHAAEVCYTVDGAIHTVSNPDGITQSGIVDLNVHSAFGLETYHLEGDINGTITQFSPEGLPEKLAHEITGPGWAIYTKKDRVVFTGAGDFGLPPTFAPTPVLEVVRKLSKVAPSHIGSATVKMITLVIEGEISFTSGNHFEQISGALCTKTPIIFTE